MGYGVLNKLEKLRINIYTYGITAFKRLLAFLIDLTITSRHPLSINIFIGRFAIHLLGLHSALLAFLYHITTISIAFASCCIHAYVNLDV